MVETSELVEEISAILSPDALWQFVKKTAYLLYIMNPKEHLFEKVEQVPDYYKEALPTFQVIVFLEIVLRFLARKPALRINDTITNVCHGMLVEIFKIPLLGIELVVYTWIYKNFRIITLPWDSPWTFLIGLFFGDFCFYCMHRSVHSVSFLWSFHEIHHSSEEYNMTVPMRLNIFTSAALWYAYLPMAFAIPPQVFLVHYQMLIIYQYLLHTEFFPRCTSVTWILNTPGLHRIHHGRNRKCIDKNFGSVLIIWDRLFGTFEPDTGELDDITYGITTPVKTFNPVLLQNNHVIQMYKKFTEVKGFKNKLYSLIKGPGWSPGKPWLGNLEDIPEPSKDEKKFDPQIPRWMKFYAVLHFIALTNIYIGFALNISELSAPILFAYSSFIILTSMSFGGIFEDRPWVMFLEIPRCLYFFVLEGMVINQEETSAITKGSFEASRILVYGTLVFWLTKQSLEILNINIVQKQSEGDTKDQRNKLSVS